MTAGTRSRMLLLLALSTCAAAILGCRQSPPAPSRAVSRPDVILITIDTLRADRIGRGLTPTLDGLAAVGTRFTNARAAVPLTLPSHATILSGLLPPHHGVRLNGTGHFADHPTLATILRASGYRTLAVVGAFVLARPFGLDAGFDDYDDAVPRDVNASTVLEAERRATTVTDAALRAVAAERVGSNPTAPLFLWVHYYDPHAPYDPPAEFLVQAGGSAYDGEVAYVDHEAARLLERLRGLRSGRDTLIVAAGDHGESLGEHGEATHGMLLYDGALRVPLIVAAQASAPAWSGARVDAAARTALRHQVRSENVSLADVAPTLLALLGIRAPAPMDGVNLLERKQPEREVYAETRYPALAGWSPITALVSGPWKLIRGGRAQLFDLAKDPAEARDGSGERAAVVSGMEARLRGTSAEGRDTTAPLSSEAADRLRSLGYVAPSSEPAIAANAPDPSDRIADWRAFEAASAQRDIRAEERGPNRDLAPEVRLKPGPTYGRKESGPASEKRRRAAIERLHDLASRNPAAQVFHTTWARALAQAGRHVEALRAYRDAVQRWPGDAVLLHDLAVAARDAGQPAEALRAEQAALAVDARFPAAVNGLGLLHADAGRPAEAAEAFARAAALDRTDPSYATNLGNARRALGQLDGARQAYLAALTVDPAWPDAANGIGVLDVQAGRASEAIPWFEKALARSPDFVEARLNLGIAYQQAGQVPRARAEYLAVLQAPARFTRERGAARQLLQGMGR